MQRSAHPIAVIGAGPVGLAAAIHLVARGLTPVVLEAGPAVAASVRQWGHVRLFSPWEFNLDPVAQTHLEARGWLPPELDDHPTGNELVERYLEPLAALPELAPHLHFNARVEAISREGLSRIQSSDREKASFVLRISGPTGEWELTADGVIDASGTWASPNPLGSNGLPALGETRFQDRIQYGIPEVLGKDRNLYAEKRVLVVGSGHSAFNALLELLELSDEAPGTTVHWAIRRTGPGRLFGGGDNDKLPERGRLGQRVKARLETGALTLHTDFRLTALDETPGGIVARAGSRTLPEVDRIICATGFRPELSLTRELRLSLDDVVESPIQLAPLIDPNLHSCGSVPPHGAEQLRHPEPNFYTVGMKSYGRAPTFLMRTGYEQVRSIAAAFAGDWEAARRVELVLPETGVCSLELDETGAELPACCGSASPSGDTRLEDSPLSSGAASERAMQPGSGPSASCCDSPEGREECCVDAAPGTCCDDAPKKTPEHPAGVLELKGSTPAPACCGPTSTALGEIRAQEALLVQIRLGPARKVAAGPSSCCGS